VWLQAWQLKKVLKKELLWMRRSLKFFSRSNMLEIVDNWERIRRIEELETDSEEL
jgi:hypothetical protein